MLATIYMNTTLKILLIFFILQIKLVAQICPKKLPIPDKIFLESVKNSDDAEVKYFKKYIGEFSKPKILKRHTETKEACETVQIFKNGIVYKKDECSETGSKVTITFPNYCKAELIKYIEWFFKSDWNVWNKNKTLYQPKEDGDAGCYIELKQNKKEFYIEYYCGC